MDASYHFPDPFRQQIPLAPPSKYIQNPTTSPHPCPAATLLVQVTIISRCNSLPTGLLALSLPPILTAARGILPDVNRILSLFCLEPSRGSYFIQSRSQKSNHGLKCLHHLPLATSLTTRPVRLPLSVPATMGSGLSLNTPGTIPLRSSVRALWPESLR